MQRSPFCLRNPFYRRGSDFPGDPPGKDPYKGRAVATVVELAPGKPDRAGKEAGVHDYYYPVMTFYASNGRLIRERYRKGSNPPGLPGGRKSACPL